MTFQISAVDWTVLGLYFVFILGIGIYLKKFTATGNG